MPTALRRLAAAAALFYLTLHAHAVVVRGRLTDALGRPIVHGHVDLQQNHLSLAQAFADEHGYFELRSSATGRFLVVSTAPGYILTISPEFYGGALDVVEQNLVASTDSNSIRQEVSVTATGLPTPLPQLTAPVTLIGEDALSLRVGVADELRQQTGVALYNNGQYGTLTSMFVRGGPSDGNKVLIDGVSAEDVGGIFDFGTPSSTGISSIETYRGPNSALFGTDSQASVVSITTPRGNSFQPLFTYSGDAGNLHTWRQEGTVSGTHKKLDYYTGASLFESSNALPGNEYHAVTEVANLGYSFGGRTSLRGTVRNADSSIGLPGAYDFTHRPQPTHEWDQDLYANATLEHRTIGDWHNLLRYGITRKREQQHGYGVNGTFLTGIPDPYSGPGATYSGTFGDLVTIQGANGYKTTSRAQLYPGTTYDQDSNRDELYYQSDYTLPKNVALLFGFRYQNERGSFNEPGAPQYDSKTQRTNFEYNLQIQGDIVNRLFYSFGGSLEKNHLYGIAGEPRFGLAYVPVRPGRGWFHGTKLRANAATGVQEPSLSIENSSLFDELVQAGDTTDIRKYGIRPLGPERSRTFDVGIDQNIHSDRLIFKAGFFHNQFSHQLEYVGSYDIQQYFGIVIPYPSAPNYFGAELNSLAYRAVGAEAEIQWQALPRLFVHGGYTFLETKVEQSLSGDVTAVTGGFGNQNPNIPNINIGSTAPLIGGRMFRRPPHTGFFAAEYKGSNWGVALKGSAVSRADDSTYLGGFAPSYGNDLLLPNRDLDYGYVKLDLGGTFPLYLRTTGFAQLENLLNNQHIGVIGYPGLPLTVRAGIKIRLGGNR